MNLKNLRGKKSQSLIAKELGITQRTFSNYESGKRQPDPEMLIKMADYFDVSVDYLLGRNDNNQTENNYNCKNTDKTVIAIGKNGKNEIYELSDEDAEFVNAYIAKYIKKIPKNK